MEISISPEVQRQAEDIRRRFVTTAAAIESDRSLSLTEQSQQLRSVRDEANRAINALRAQVLAGPLLEQDALMTKLFSPPVPATASLAARAPVDDSFRSALKDAAAAGEGYWALGASKLLPLYRRAQAVNDQLLARAALVESFSRSDRAVWQAYALDHPAEADAVARLAELLKGTPSTEATVSSVMVAMTLPHV